MMRCLIRSSGGLLILTLLLACGQIAPSALAETPTGATSDLQDKGSSADSTASTSSTDGSSGADDIASKKVGSDDITSPGTTSQSATAREASAETPNDFSVHGIDVSHFQGQVDWAAVAASGKTFAIVKATEGIDYVDPTFADHWQDVREHGLLRGAYHFFVAHDDAKTQAEFFLSTVDFEDGDLIPVLDVETRGQVPSDELLQGVKTWLELVEGTLGQRPMIYTDTNFWDSLGDASSAADGFGHHPLWVAEYSSDGPRLPEGWKGWQLWQFTQKGRVAGVTGEVDLSAFQGTADDMKEQLTLELVAKATAED